MTQQREEERLVKKLKLKDSVFLDNPCRMQKAVDLVTEFKDVFARDEGFVITGLVQHQINTGDSPPVNTKHSTINPVLGASLKRQLKAWRRRRTIEPSSSPWNSDLVPFTSKNNTTRWYLDYQRLNEVTLQDTFPLPDVGNCTAQLSRTRVFSGIDGRGTCHRMEIAPQDREKTAFSTPWGRWQFRRVPFGLRNIETTYGRLMQAALQGIPHNAALVNHGGIVVHSADMRDHFENLREVLKAYRKTGLKLNPAKCRLFRDRLGDMKRMVNLERIMQLTSMCQECTAFQPGRARDTLAQLESSMQSPSTAERKLAERRYTQRTKDRADLLMASAARRVEEELGRLRVADLESARTAKGFRTAAAIRAAVLEAEGRAAVERRERVAKQQEKAVAWRAEVIRLGEVHAFAQRKRRAATIRMVKELEEATFGPGTLSGLSQQTTKTEHKSDMMTIFPGLSLPLALAKPIRFAPLKRKAPLFPNPSSCEEDACLNAKPAPVESTKGGYAMVEKFATSANTWASLVGVTAIGEHLKGDPRAEECGV